MKIETELKYLVSNIIPKYDEKIAIEQIYLLPNEEEQKVLKKKAGAKEAQINTYRIRFVKTKNNNKYLLTLKTKGDISREEYEVSITKEDYQKYQEISNESKIIKNRYIKNHKGYIFEFDEYLNVEPIFYTCEIELDNDIENNKKIIEDILINDFNLTFTDVTREKKYKNKYLYKYFCIK